MINKKEFDEILKHREKLKEQIHELTSKLKCKHVIDIISFNGDCTQLSCFHCNEGFPMTHSDDGSCMSEEHMRQYNRKDKTQKEQKWFRKYLNEKLQYRIKDIQKTLDNMLVINYYKRLPFQKPRIEILQFDKGGVCKDMYRTSMGIVIPTSYNGDKRIFMDKQLEMRNGILSSDPDSEWGENDD